MSTIKQNSLIDSYIIIAWEILRGENDKGIPYNEVHTTWTPFNRLFRQLFTGVDPVAYTKMLETKGMITLGIAKGGARLKPCESLLKPAPSEHKETIAMMRRLLIDVAAETLAKKEKRLAEKSWAAGDTRSALKRLGYG